MSAAALRYGAQGNRWLPPAPPSALVRVRCWCGTWWETPAHVDRECSLCNTPMRRAA